MAAPDFRLPAADSAAHFRHVQRRLFRLAVRGGSSGGARYGHGQGDRLLQEQRRHLRVPSQHTHGLSVVSSPAVELCVCEAAVCWVCVGRWWVRR